MKRNSALTSVSNRIRVLDRINRRDTPLVVLLAPAGYGKTHIAHKLASWYEKSLYVQCSKSPGFEGALIQLLDAGGGTVRDIMEAWRNYQNTALIIDNIECLRWHPAAIGLVRSLLEADHGNNRIIFCGRLDPGLQFAAATTPHTMTFLRSEQLAFDQGEMRELFEATSVTDAMRYRLHVFTGGWPAAALYCAQYAVSGDADELFDSQQCAFADFLDYIDANVFVNLPEHVLRGLGAAIGVPGIRAKEVADIYGGEQADVVTDMTRVYQVASQNDLGGFNVLALLRLALVAKRPEFVTDAQQAVGQLCAEREEYSRAAQAYLASGDAAMAEQLLKRGRSAGPTSFSSFFPLPETGPGTDLLSNPTLWAAVLGARRISEHPSVLANEALTVLQTLDERADPIVVMQVRALSALAFMDAGIIEVAAALVDVDLNADAEADAQPAQTPEPRSILQVLAMKSTLYSYVGKVDRALAIWPRIRQFAVENPTVLAQLTAIDVRAARYRGEWMVEHYHLQRMLDAAREGRAVTIIAMALAEGVFGSWLAGEVEIFDDYVAQLAALTREHELPALLNFQLASLGLQPTPKSVSKYWDAMAFLMACGREADSRRAAELARTACDYADESGATFLQVLTHVALSQMVPAMNADLLQKAVSLAQAVDSSPLRQSAQSLLSHTTPARGMLATFVARHQRTGEVTQTVPDMDLRISLADATVRVNGKAAPISEGGWGLLLTLSLGRPVHRDVLCDRLWPAMPLESAYNALKMSVRRTRLQLAAAEAIISTQGGYALADWVRVDLAEMEQLQTAIQKGSLEDEQASEVRKHFDAIRHGRPANFAMWDWFTETEQHLESLARSFGQYLGRRAITLGDFQSAIEIGEYLRKVDPLDEEARKLLIAAHVARNDEAAAKRELRQYQKVLKEELDIEPSPELKRLLAR